MELVFGSVRFELKQGTKSTFAQEVVAIDPHSKYPTTVCLGSLRRRYTAIPDVQQLLERTTL
ncbi:hypothetical protein PTSG_11574 [Salpingoeca rosetta]|uniref:Uncharacterized protein n=1 Tax=Salpingoeca rosetta (strain ATCC 50818 / BSB-021) TaxID=946362 RepID=F2TW44_SALR5|nr:uncharacterized protein PTSG_11574 [Salpingoeca rosetta]EGD72290.1 hypothetical protein PTSG_11574 [Salpingoeca rosetta]|eukprot:XP_004998860.1 hypothetical protein PTSG_11574 [Salpingoeca rosetta]